MNKSVVNITNKDISKNKVLLLSDSHGRGYSDILENYLGKNYEITSFVKPNATLNGVVDHLTSLISSYRKNDYVIIIGGTNNYPNNFLRLTDTYESIVQQCKRTNLIMCTTPYRPNVRFLNNDIYYMNSILYDIIMKYQDCYLLDINFYLKDSDYKRDGLHFKFPGKDFLCNKLSTVIKNGGHL